MFQRSLGSEPDLIAAALTAVYIVLGVHYESYILPLTILSTLPSAGVGASLMLMLMLAHTDVSLIAMIGIIMLIRIVKKNGIMMVDFAIHAERSEGMAPGRDYSADVLAAVPAEAEDDDGGAAVGP